LNRSLTAHIWVGEGDDLRKLSSLSTSLLDLSRASCPAFFALRRSRYFQGFSQFRPFSAMLARIKFVQYHSTMTDCDDIDSRIGARIRTERESRGWSLTDLAGKASVSRAMIHRIERGGSSPTAALLAKLSGAFGLSMSTLLARAETGQGRLLRHGEQPLWTDPDTGYLRRHISPRSDLPLDLRADAGLCLCLPAPDHLGAQRRSGVDRGRDTP
jgi:transcriptional regulator with XRE-family HTH domain